MMDELRINVELDNRIYTLLNSPLPDELRQKAVDADLAYLSDQNDRAIQLCDEVEAICKRKGITLTEPLFKKAN